MPLDGEPFKGPVPKTGKRVVDPKALKQARKPTAECVVCERRAENLHHLVPKGSPHFGDDVPENLVPLCGSGSAKCHGALHGNPYTDSDGHRWTQKEVQRMVGIWLLRNPEHLRYAVGRAGEAWVRRTFHLPATLVKAAVGG